MIEMYLRGYTSIEAAAAVGKTFPSCILVLKQAGIPRRSRSDAARSISMDDYQTMVEAYESGKSQEEAAAIIGRSHSSCALALSKLGKKSRAGGGIRKYSVINDFFSSIATEAQAYLLGFISADGCVYHKPHRTPVLSIGLASIDEDHLRHIMLCLMPRGTLSHIQKSVRLRVVSHQIIHDLESLGLAPRKSLTLVPWHGPDHLMRHYWRGMIDGDGSWGRNKKKNSWWFSFCGTQPCIDAWSMFMAAHGIPPMSTRPQGKIWYTSTSGRPKPAQVARLLYEDCKIALPRKLALAKQLVKEAFDYDMAGEAFVPPEMCAPRPKISLPKS